MRHYYLCAEPAWFVNAYFGFAQANTLVHAGPFTTSICMRCVVIATTAGRQHCGNPLLQLSGYLLNFLDPVLTLK